MAEKTPSPRSSTSDSQLEFMGFLDDQRDIDITKQCLANEKITQSDVQNGGIRGAIKYLSAQRSPKILLVDISGVDLPVSELNNLSEVCEPGTKVITVGARNDVGLFRDLMSMGITDYLVKPLLPDILMNAVKVIYEGDSRPKKTGRTGKVISFVGARGGTGTTMMASTFSWILSQERSRRVALVDFDIHLGTVSLYLDQKPNHGLRESLENPDRIDAVFLDRLLVKVSDRLLVLSSEEPLNESVDFTVDGVETLLDFLVKQFHYVVIDFPRQFNDVTRSLMQHTHTMVVVAEPSLASARDTERMIRLFSPFGGARSMLVVVNKVGEYKKGEVSIEEFESAISRKVDLKIPYDNTDISDLLNRGQPVTTSKSSRVPNTIRHLVDLMGGGIIETEDEGIFSRIMSILR